MLYYYFSYMLNPTYSVFDALSKGDVIRETYILGWFYYATFLSSSINPIIHFSCNSKMRVGAKSLFRCMRNKVAGLSGTAWRFQKQVFCFFMILIHNVRLYGQLTARLNVVIFHFISNKTKFWICCVQNTKLQITELLIMIRKNTRYFRDFSNHVTAFDQSLSRDISDL